MAAKAVDEKNIFPQRSAKVRISVASPSAGRHVGGAVWISDVSLRGSYVLCGASRYGAACACLTVKRCSTRFASELRFSAAHVARRTGALHSHLWTRIGKQTWWQKNNINVYGGTALR